jgi:hypothetical protein
VIKLLRTVLASLWIILRTLLYGWILAFWGLLKLIWARCQPLKPTKTLSQRQGASPDQCVTFSDPAMKRPDPLIYDQYYLMALGFAVTWDNPDIWLEKGGVVVSPDQLTPSTTYEVVARIWNSSTEAVVAGLPVTFSYLSFGIGIQRNPVFPGPGTVMVNLGAKGGPSCPTFARTQWTTPAVPGHYCLQASFSWFDDSNPYNNLGQKNTQVGVSVSPVVFEFQLRNGKLFTQTFRFETDAYAIPPLPACSNDSSRTTVATTVAQRPYGPVKVPPQHTRLNYPLPEGWSIAFAPDNPGLSAGEEITVVVTVSPPAGFQGHQPINVHAFSGSSLEGGVTFFVEGS